MDKRPILNKTISIKDLKEFYWLKEELVKFCRIEGLKTTGGKIEITERIENYLRTGEKNLKREHIKEVSKSKFDWKKEKLTLQTTITDNYKNTENVRNFLIDHIGKHFKFNVKFMNWMKTNSDKNLSDAINQWKFIYSESKNSKAPKKIAPQFEYNNYLRDFLADNPNLRREVGINLWKIKKSLRGDNKYSKEDLNLIDKN